MQPGGSFDPGTAVKLRFYEKADSAGFYARELISAKTRYTAKNIYLDITPAYVEIRDAK